MRRRLGRLPRANHRLVGGSQCGLDQDLAGAKALTLRFPSFLNIPA
jgi:hypothetical protein